ncbi:MAG: GNAT family N-acetyltransferase [Clostridia bacterium]|nr:GNAT family N-acetyltransferase [Clostridia bacterium]
MNITLAPMTDEMYHRYLKEYDNDPDLYLPGQTYTHYVYSEERAEQYIKRQKTLHRIPLAILLDDEIVGEIVIKNIEPHRSATFGIALKNARYKDQGIGTEAERLLIRYVFDTLGIPALFANTVRSNTRSQHILEKLGFRFLREDENFRFFRLNRAPDTPRETTE